MVKVFFCEYCSDLLYPRAKRLEDSNEERLVYMCRRCQIVQEENEYCVYSHQIAHIPTEDTMETKDIATDPALPRRDGELCPSCGANEPVFFQSTSSHPDTKMTLYFVCSNAGCAHRWNVNQKRDEYVE